MKKLILTILLSLVLSCPLYGASTMIIPSNATGKLDIDYYMKADEYALVTSGNIAIDWDNGSTQYTVLTDNIVFTPVPVNPVGGQVYRINISATIYSVTWWAGIKWYGGLEPTLTTTADHYDAITCLYVNSMYLCSAVLDFY